MAERKFIKEGKRRNAVALQVFLTLRNSLYVEYLMARFSWWSNNSDATIAMATEYFSYGNENGSDIFTLNDWEGERPVYYKVTEFKGSTSEELAAQLTDKYADKYYSVDISQEEIGEYDALVMYFETDKEDFNDYQLLFYIIENDDGCVVIEVQLTLEMYQNIYAVIRNCINFFSMK